MCPYCGNEEVVPSCPFLGGSVRPASIRRPTHIQPYVTFLLAIRMIIVVETFEVLTPVRPMIFEEEDSCEVHGHADT